MKRAYSSPASVIKTEWRHARHCVSFSSRRRSILNAWRTSGFEVLLLGFKCQQDPERW